MPCIPARNGATTVQREYLKALMLTMSATDSLLPRKLEIAERIVSQYADQFVMQRQPAKGCHCTVDLQAAKPPARMVAQVSPAASLRYFGPGAAAEAVDQVIDAVTESGMIPSSVNLGGSYEPSFVVEVLRHLARHWSAVPPARKQERKQTFARIHVVHDFDDVVAIIAGESKDLDFQQNIETWTVENESEGGYGADHPRFGHRLAAGRHAAWHQARRRQRVGRGHRAAADQRRQQPPLRRDPDGVQGRRASESVPGRAEGRRRCEGVDAVLLPSSSADSMGTGELSLLMRMGTFSPKQSLQMRAYERDYLLVPKQLLEGGQDFDMAKFRVLQRAA